MKKLIQNTGGYQLYAELRPIPALKGEYELRFTTVYDHAKDPDDEHIAAKFILTEDAVNNLWDVLNEDK